MTRWAPSLGGNVHRPALVRVSHSSGRDVGFVTRVEGDTTRWVRRFDESHIYEHCNSLAPKVSRSARVEKSKGQTRAAP